MNTNNEIYFEKLGEILIDINTKCKRKKTLIFHCIFCNMKCNQFEKFFLHIDAHLTSTDNVLEESVLKFETDPEEIAVQTFVNSAKPKSDSDDFIIREIKQENTNDSDIYDSDQDISETSEFISTRNDEKSSHERVNVHQSKKIKTEAIHGIVPNNSKDIHNKDQPFAANSPKNIRDYEENSQHVDTSSARRYISKRIVRDLEDCNKKCKEKITKEEQQYIFTKYWSLGVTHQKLFVADSIDVEYNNSKANNNSNIRRRLHTFKYFLELPNRSVPVCQKCFRYTLCEGEKFIKTTMKMKIEGKLENNFFFNCNHL